MDLIHIKATEIFAAYVSNNPVSRDKICHVFDDLCGALHKLNHRNAQSPKTSHRPSERDIRSSIQQDGLISILDGRSYKTLKRHLTAHGLTPELYRAKYGLPADYPMVAPGYAAKRSEIARGIQLGHKLLGHRAAAAS